MTVLYNIFLIIGAIGGWLCLAMFARNVYRIYKANTGL